MKDRLMIRRREVLAGTAISCMGFALPSLAQGRSFPKNSVRFVVPFAAGGAADVATRPLAKELEPVWKQPVLVDNRPGGLFMIGLQAALQAPADGHTLMYLTNSMAAVQAVHKQYDLGRQLIPVTQTVSFPMVMLVPGNSPFKTVEDLVAYARDNPNKLRYSSVGVGSTEHLKTVEFQKAARFEADHIPYKSGPDMVVGLLGAQVDLTLTAANFAYTYAPKGQVRVLAVLGSQRIKEMPDVPTLRETGFDVSPFNFWSGYAVKAGTPAPVVQLIYQDLATAAVTPFMNETLAGLGMSPAVSKSPDAFAKLIADELAWAMEQSKGIGPAS